MAPAAAGMTHAWNHGVSAKAPRAPIVSNLDAGLILNPERLKRDIVASIHKPVLWSSALNVMKDQGVTRFVFVGPGKALANLARKELKSGKWKEWKDDVQFGTVATEECMRNTSELCGDLVEDVAESVEAQLRT
jgi:malonyl CoA-acyl carrier protein transacylase